MASTTMLMLMLLLSLISTLTTPLIIPPPLDKTHWFETAISTLTLKRASIPDRLNASATTRNLHLTLFYPIQNTVCTARCTVPYMPPLVAAAAARQFGLDDNDERVFNNVLLSACCASEGHTHYPGMTRLLVLEPGVATSRHLYGGMAQRVAAAGFSVVTIDHAYDVAVVGFGEGAGGSVALDPFGAVTEWNDTVAEAVAARVDDVRFVVERLADVEVVRGGLAGFDIADGFYTGSMGIAGHGIGGAVASTFGFGFLDARFPVSINMGGTPPLLTRDTLRPTVFFGREDARREDDVFWPATWKHLFGPATELDLEDSGIFDFSDLPMLVNRSGMSVEGGGARLPKGLGSIGMRGFNATAAAVEAYMRQEFWKDTLALTDARREFPGLQMHQVRPLA